MVYAEIEALEQKMSRVFINAVSYCKYWALGILGHFQGEARKRKRVGGSAFNMFTISDDVRNPKTPFDATAVFLLTLVGPDLVWRLRTAKDDKRALQLLGELSVRVTGGWLTECDKETAYNWILHTVWRNLHHQQRKIGFFY
jgi:hypothetical protein